MSDTADETPISELKTVPGVRYRWKPKGYARKVWWDILLPNPTLVTDLRRAISAALGLGDSFHAWGFFDHERYTLASTAIPHPEDQTSRAPSADEVTGEDFRQRFDLDTGDRAYFIYDFGTPTVTYGIMKETVTDVSTFLSENEFQGRCGDAFVVRGKGDYQDYVRY